MFSIGKLGQAAGVKVPTIRYYEDIGLLPEAERNAGNQRVYGKQTLERLSFIRHGRDLGFTLEAIRDLLSLSDDPDQSCEVADNIAKEQLIAVKFRIKMLKALQKELENMVGQCANGKVSDCRVISVMGNHSLCLHKDHTAPKV